MIQLSYEFRIVREAVYMAINIVDNFFQSTVHLPKHDFQLAGAAALFLACKLELKDPISSDKFAESTKDSYTA